MNAQTAGSPAMTPFVDELPIPAIAQPVPELSSCLRFSPTCRPTKGKTRFRPAPLRL